MYFEISVSFSRKSFKSAKSRHSEDSELVRQVFIVQKIIPGDMICYKNQRTKFCLPMASIHLIDVIIRMRKEIMIPDFVKVGLFGQVRPVGEVI